MIVRLLVAWLLLHHTEACTPRVGDALRAWTARLVADGLMAEETRQARAERARDAVAARAGRVGRARRRQEAPVHESSTSARARRVEQSAERPALSPIVEGEVLWSVVEGQEHTR